MATPADAHPPNALPVGTRLGEFELRRVLGVGGFGIVYLAFDHALEREVAVKEYMPASLAGRTATLQVSVLSQAQADTFALGLRSFVNEARLLARFDHPSLVKVHRYWEANQTAYMAMPYYRGPNLHHVQLTRSQPPDEAWLRALTEPLLGAIELLHAQGVFHRDISPDNIILQPDGRPVLLDFGAARRVLGDKSVALTAILKPAYAPIEQYAEAGSVKQGPWTDLYALGATLHHLLTGHAPPPATARTVQDDMVPLTAQRLAGCTPGFLHAIDWMLRPRPADRPHSVADLRAVLGGAMAVPVPASAGWVPTQVMAAPTAPTEVLAPGTAMAPTEVLVPTEVMPRPVAAAAAEATELVAGDAAAPAGVAAENAGAGVGGGADANTAANAFSAGEDEGNSAGKAIANIVPQPAAFSADRDRATQPPPRRARWPLPAGVVALALATGLGWLMLGQRSAPSTAASAPSDVPVLLPAAPAAEPASAAPRDTAAATPRDEPPPATSMATAANERATPAPAPTPAPRATPPAVAEATPTGPARPSAGAASPSATATTAGTTPGAARIAATGPSVPGALPPRPQGGGPTPAAMPTLPPTAVATQAGQAAEPMRPVTLATPAPPSPATAAPAAPAPATSPAPAPTRPLPTPSADPMVQARVLGPSERCEGRVLLALYTCIESQCNRMPELREHPECVKLRRDQEQRAGGVKN